ncbi:hypothetical protein ACQY0O_007798 [Thecaphora frezii]
MTNNHLNQPSLHPAGSLGAPTGHDGVPLARLDRHFHDGDENVQDHGAAHSFRAASPTAAAAGSSRRSQQSTTFGSVVKWWT